MVLNVAELCFEFVRWCEANLSARTVDYYKRYLFQFAESVRGLPVQSLRPYHLLKWADRRHKTRSVQRLFNWASDYAGFLSENPFRRVKLQRAGRRRRVLSRAGIAQIMRRSGRPFREFLLAMRETLARPQEICNLRWEDLAGSGSEDDAIKKLSSPSPRFVLWDYKGQDRRTNGETPRILFISPRFRRLLIRIAARSPACEGVIFRNSRGLPWTRNATRCAMRRVRENIGLLPDHRGEMVCCYTLRHSMATIACAAGVRDRMLADILGHTSTRMTSRYQHLSADHLGDAMERVWNAKKPALPPARSPRE